MLRRSFGVAILIGIIAVLGGWYVVHRDDSRPTESEFAVTTREADQTSELAYEPVVEVTGLSVPWELVFLPDGSMLVAERPGRLVNINEGKSVIPVSGVQHRGEGGLLGLALHPRFSENNWIYVYLTTSEEGLTTNRVERYRLTDTTLSDRTVILEGIPGSSNHNGGRIAFGPDDMLYIATGDAGDAGSAQNTSSLAGKILRVHDDGSIPDNNPFGNAVYSYGHRNIQGLAWDTSGTLWATEHGRSGLRSGFDELNRIIKGGNYGWPDVQGDESGEGIIVPEVHSGADTTWAPSGMAFADDSLFFTGLRGESLYEVALAGDRASEVKAHFSHTYGRLRTVVVGPDDALYMLTNNRDGRGEEREGDDKIIRIPLSVLSR